MPARTSFVCAISVPPVLSASCSSVPIVSMRRLASAVSAISISSRVKRRKPAQHLLPHAGRGRLLQRRPRRLRVARRGEAARVDGVDADVRPVRLADRREQHVLERRRGLDALREEQDRLAPGERLLLLREREDREQRGLPLLLALQRVRHAQRVHDHVRHVDLLTERGGRRLAALPDAGAGDRFEAVAQRVGARRRLGQPVDGARVLRVDLAGREQDRVADGLVVVRELRARAAGSRRSGTRRRRRRAGSPARGTRARPCAPCCGRPGRAGRREASRGSGGGSPRAWAARGRGAAPRRAPPGRRRRRGRPPSSPRSRVSRGTGSPRLAAGRRPRTPRPRRAAGRGRCAPSCRAPRRPGGRPRCRRGRRRAGARPGAAGSGR